MEAVGLSRISNSSQLLEFSTELSMQRPETNIVGHWKLPRASPYHTYRRVNWIA